MKLEQLVAPLWFAKKLPKDMETVFVYRSNCKGCNHDCHDVAIQFAKDLVKEYRYAPAPTLPEMLPLLEDRVIDFVRVTKQEYLTHAFVTELKKEGEGWKFLDSLLFPKV